MMSVFYNITPISKDLNCIQSLLWMEALHSSHVLESDVHCPYAENTAKSHKKSNSACPSGVGLSVDIGDNQGYVKFYEGMNLC